MLRKQTNKWMNMRESEQKMPSAVLWIRMWLRNLNVLIGFVRVAFMNYDGKNVAEIKWNDLWERGWVSMSLYCAPKCFQVWMNSKGKPHVMVVGVEASEESRARDNWNWFIGLKHKTRFDSLLIQIDWLIRMKWIHYRVAFVQDCILFI